MKLIQIYYSDLLNGVGLRNVYFFSGCTHGCPGCFNKETWSPSVGTEWTETDMRKLVEEVKKPYISGITLSGGDPLGEFNASGVFELLEEFRREIGNEKTVWVYTGHTWEYLLSKYGPSKLALIDVICDGPFLEARKSPSKPWVGSENQRVIDVKASLREGRVIEIG